MSFLRRKSYDVLPALSIQGRDLRRSMRTVTVAWIFGVMWMTCIAGSRMTIFGRILGCTDLHFGLISAIPFATVFGQLVSAIVVEQTGLRKYLYLSCALLHRAMWFAIAAIPLIFPLPSRPAIWTLLGMLTVSWFLAAVSMPAWTTWMGDLIPRRIRGRYFAARARLGMFVRIPLIIAMSLVLDALTRHDPASGEILPMTPADQPLLLWAICGVFVLAGLLGSIDVLQFRKIRDLLRSTGDEPSPPAVVNRLTPPGKSRIARVVYPGRYALQVVEQFLIDPLRDRSFRRYVVFGMAVTFCMGVGGPYYWRNLLENLEFSQFGTDFIFLVIGPLAGIASAGIWGRLIDRWGRRPALIIAAAFTVCSITPYLIAARTMGCPQFVPDTVNSLAALIGGWVGRPGWQWLTPEMPVGPWLIMAAALVFGGTGWCGLVLAQQGIILGFADGRGRSKYVAAFSVLAATGGMIGGVVGGLVADALAFLQDDPILLGPFLWNNWHAAFLMSLLARITALVCAIRLPDPGARRFRDMARYLGISVYNQTAVMLLYRLRIFGRSNRKD